jgi:aldose 1-epimerase
MTVLPLRTGRLEVDLAPRSGGSIARFTVAGSDVLRPATAEALASGVGKDTACYPLVPFSNRIAGGRLQFDGRTIQLAPNWPGVRHPMHGDGWARPWQVEHSDAGSADLVHHHDGRTGWPFRYRARQGFRLSPNGLTVAMSIENLEEHAVPAGLGLHPFFVREPDTELCCRAEAVWRTDAEVLPTERTDVPTQWDFSALRKVTGVALDNCFDGWDGRAVINWPSRRLRLELRASEPFRHLVIYSPAGQGFFCVEPVSHANGRLADTRLAAGATLAGEIAFDFSDA